MKPVIAAVLLFYAIHIRERVLRTRIAIRIRKRIFRTRDRRLNFSHIHNDSPVRKVL